jgi:hypothetical protein
VDCPFFQEDLHAKTFVYTISLLLPLWTQRHYRNPTFYDDLMKNLRNIAIPGTCFPLSWIAISRIFIIPFLLFIYPFLCAAGSFIEISKAKKDKSVFSNGIGFFMELFLQKYCQIFINPQHWFSFWRINCHLVSLHSLKSTTKDYLMENKWEFLIDGEAKNVSVSPFLKEPKAFVIKDRNEEGGMGIHVFQNAVAGGDWIIQEKLENSDFISSLLPDNAPLSTFRIITTSRYGLGLSEEELSTANNGESGIKSLSCVFRAGLRNAPTDHESIMFDVDMNTGEIKTGSTTTHWYKIGLQHLFHTELSVGHDITHHPDTKVKITGNIVKDIEKMKKLVEDAHFKLMKEVPICGWDIAVTTKGIFLLEVNISCNFFRGTFDQPAYFQFLDEYFRHLEKIPIPLDKKRQ